MGSAIARAGMTTGASFQKVPKEQLFVSEPDPRMFGNPSNQRLPTWTNTNWLKSRFHFSFAEYNNSKRSCYGSMRVMNDDLVQPQRGFGVHSHRDAEIVTYVVEGELTHKDSMGTAETLGAGSVQFMSAGSGVSHSEHNLHPERPLRFIQMWFDPRRRGVTPNYGSLDGQSIDCTNKWFPLVSDVEGGGESGARIKLHQDLNLYVAKIDEGVSLDFHVKAGRMAYLLCMDGVTTVQGAHTSKGDGKSEDSWRLERHEAAHVTGENALQLSGKAHCLMVEMKQVLE